MSTGTNIEFGVHHVSQCARDTIAVEGRCYSGKITIGHEFRKVYAASVEKTQKAYKDVGRIQLAAINLRVMKIEAYNHEVPEIESGLTARLHLSGSGAEQVTGNTILGSD